MKKIVFLSGTRADWGKMKSLITQVANYPDIFEYKIFVCGMHLLELYGQTFIEILKDGFYEVFLSAPYKNLNHMDLIFSEAVKNFSNFISDFKPDMIVVHGDRLEALAGAIVGAFNNIIVSHIEGGEISGTIDESIRHSVSKFAHLHFVANIQAKQRLLQLGELEDRIFSIGSPDIDLMLSKQLPNFQVVQKYYYQIQPFNRDYAIFIYHPVTTELKHLQNHIIQIIKALKQSCLNFIIIYPNNDHGSQIIIQEIKKLENCKKFAIFASIKFEYFLVLLKYAKFIIGNSSCGIREAPVYGIPCINLGTRQEGRYQTNSHLLSVPEDTKQILHAIEIAKTLPKKKQKLTFGRGCSATEFIKILLNNKIWEINLQKKFIDLVWE